MKRNVFVIALAMLALMGFCPRANAQWAVVDVGANLGEWTLPLAKAVGPNGRVLCCEPNPSVAAALAATLAINNLAQARVIRIAAAHSLRSRYVLPS